MRQRRVLRGIGRTLSREEFHRIGHQGSPHVDRCKSGRRKRDEKRRFPAYPRGRTGIHFRSRRNFRNMDHLSRPANGKSPQASHGNPFPFPISKILKRERAHSFENRQSFPLSIHGRACENQSSTREHQHERSLRERTG